MKGSITAAEIEGLLDLTHFHRNIYRKNVTPDDLSFVHSETAGASELDGKDWLHHCGLIDIRW